MSKEEKFYSFQEILKFLGIDSEFNDKRSKYPFNRERKFVHFSWGHIIIPKFGIREMVQNKISDIKEQPISEITMIYCIPFIEDQRGTNNCGVLNQNISLSFRYDKQFKYGDINKSIYEVCFFILEHAIETNDFFIIDREWIHEFMSYFVFNNQYGLGRLVVCSNCMEKLEQE